MVNEPLAAVIATSIVTSAVVIISVTRMLVHRNKSSAIAPSQVREIETQLRELASSVDAIAIEVERISEGQRFTTKLLADRANPAAEAPRPPRVITPH
jgi:predicted ATP-dependent serine protease